MGVVKDRRQSVRVMVRGDAVVHLPPGRLEGRCLDLSTGGLLVLGPARTRPEAGTRLEVEIHVEGEHLRIAAELLRSREVKAGQLLAFRFVDPTAEMRARLREIVDGKLLRTINSDAAVVLDLRALRRAAAGSSAEVTDEPSPAATPIAETNDERSPAVTPSDETEPASSERPRYVPVVFQGTWRDDELVTQEFQAIEPLRGGTMIAPAPEPPPDEPTATFGPAPAPAPAIEPTTVLSLDETAPDETAGEVDAAPSDDRGPTEGTVVLAPALPSASEPSQDLDTPPPEPTVRYAISPMAEAHTEPTITPVASTTSAHAPDEAAPHRAPTMPADASIPREPPSPPPLLRGEPIAISGETVVIAVPEVPPPRPSQLALAAALSLLRRRGPASRPGTRPPRVIVSVAHYQLPARPSPWSPRP